MIVELDNVDALKDRAKYLMDKYSLEAFEAIKWAEQEIEEQMKKGDLKYEEYSY